MALMGPTDQGWPENPGGRPSGHRGWSMLHSLARRLADEYSAPVTRASSIIALRTLLPNLEHYSIGVIAKSGRIVASSHQAAPGPSMVSFHGLRTSCMGIAAERRKTLVSTISSGEKPWVSSFSDVSQMVDAAKSCTHFICTPFSDCESEIKGALLVGLSGPPALPSARMTILTRLQILAQFLSVALRQTAPQALCIVETVLGNHDGCDVCTCSGYSGADSTRDSVNPESDTDYEESLRDDEEEDEEEEEGERAVAAWRPVTPDTPIGIAHRLRFSDSSSRLTGYGSLTDSELEFLSSRFATSKVVNTDAP